MHNILRGLILIIMLAIAGSAMAAATRLHDARMWESSDKTRVVFDLSSDTQPEIFMVDDPLRLVVDLPHTKTAEKIAGAASQSQLIKEIRTGIHQGNGLRVVLDLKQMVSPKSFMLEPKGKHAYRLVVDLYPRQDTPTTQIAANAQHDGNRQGADPGDDSAGQTATDGAQASDDKTHRSDADTKPPSTIARQKPDQDIVLAIDAGHGGRDPGAHGPHGALEKNVTLAIARRLKRMVDDQPHMHGVLTRKDDHYVGLRERMEIARRDKADFFVSIHTDATPSGGHAQGASVYALSPHGATSEHARWLARRENAADLVGGASLKDKNSSLASFMLDLSQGTSIDASLDAGKRVLAQLENVGSLHKSSVQQAGFMVLKSPDIPSILVETNFISNATQERKLVNSRYQNELAGSMLRGIKGYFAGYRPATSIAAEQQHRVRRGETLSGIAQTYGVSVAALRRYNDLNNNRISVGLTLQIPAPNQRLADRG